MGFSPGDFQTRFGASLHFEQKDDRRIVLWTHDELVKLFELDVENTKKVIAHLTTCLAMMCEEI